MRREAARRNAKSFNPLQESLSKALQRLLYSEKSPHLVAASLQKKVGNIFRGKLQKKKEESAAEKNWKRGLGDQLQSCHSCQTACQH